MAKELISFNGIGGFEFLKIPKERGFLNLKESEEALLIRKVLFVINTSDYNVFNIYIKKEIDNYSEF